MLVPLLELAWGREERRSWAQEVLGSSQCSKRLVEGQTLNRRCVGSVNIRGQEGCWAPLLRQMNRVQNLALSQA